MTFTLTPDGGGELAELLPMVAALIDRAERGDGIHVYDVRSKRLSRANQEILTRLYGQLVRMRAATRGGQ